MRHGKGAGMVHAGLVANTIENYQS